MGLTVVEIMALIFLLVAAVKIVVILVNPKSWFELTKQIWLYPGLTMIISLALAILSLFYLLDNGVTVVDLFAVMLFVSFLAAVGVAIYSKEVMKIAEKLMKDKKLVQKSWLYITIWIVLVIWGFKELFFP